MSKLACLLVLVAAATSSSALLARPCGQSPKPPASPSYKVVSSGHFLKVVAKSEERSQATAARGRADVVAPNGPTCSGILASDSSALCYYEEERGSGSIYWYLVSAQ